MKTTLLDVLAALGKFVTVATAWAENATDAELATFTQLPAPEEKTEKAPEPVNFEKLRALLASLSRKGYTVQVKELISKYGADKLSAVKPENYAALMADAEVLDNAG